MLSIVASILIGHLHWAIFYGCKDRNQKTLQLYFQLVKVGGQVCSSRQLCWVQLERNKKCKRKMEARREREEQCVEEEELMYWLQVVVPYTVHMYM